MNICKNCIRWKRLGSTIMGICNDPHFVECGDDIKDGVVYSDRDWCEARLDVGESFGCIHFQSEETK